MHLVHIYTSMRDMAHNGCMVKNNESDRHHSVGSCYVALVTTT